MTEFGEKEKGRKKATHNSIALKISRKMGHFFLPSVYTPMC